MPEVISPGPAAVLKAASIRRTEDTSPFDDPASASAVSRHDEPPDRLSVLLRVAHRGFSVLRFNFRGVGRSQGAFDHGTGDCRMRRPRSTGRRDHRIPRRAPAGSPGFLLRRLDRHAASDAPARGRRFHLDRDRPPISMTSPSSRPAPPRADRAWREGRGGAAERRQHAGREAEDAEGHRDRPAGRSRRQSLLRRQARAADGRPSRPIWTCGSPTCASA